MTSRALQIAASIALDAERECIPVDDYLAAKQARIEAHHRALTSRKARPLTIICYACGGDAMVDVVDASGNHVVGREKCDACDIHGHALCGCGYPATVEAEGLLYCQRCLTRAPELVYGKIIVAALERLS
jgi:hypothetical protein